MPTPALSLSPSPQLLLLASLAPALLLSALSRLSPQRPLSFRRFPAFRSAMLAGSTLPHGFFFRPHAFSPPRISALGAALSPLARSPAFARSLMMDSGWPSPQLSAPWPLPFGFSLALLFWAWLWNLGFSRFCPRLWPALRPLAGRQPPRARLGTRSLRRRLAPSSGSPAPAFPFLASLSAA